MSISGLLALSMASGAVYWVRSKAVSNRLKKCAAVPVPPLAEDDALFGEDEFVAYTAI